MTINLFPEGREMTGDVILGDGVKMLFDGETWTLAEDTKNSPVNGSDPLLGRGMSM